MVELLNERMLPQNAFIVYVPARAVEKVQVVRDFDESNARLNQPPGQKASLPELTAVSIAQARRFLVQRENPLELRPR